MINSVGFKLIHVLKINRGSTHFFRRGAQNQLPAQLRAVIPLIQNRRDEQPRFDGPIEEIDTDSSPISSARSELLTDDKAIQTSEANRTQIIAQNVVGTDRTTQTEDLRQEASIQTSAPKELIDQATQTHDEGQEIGVQANSSIPQNEAFRIRILELEIENFKLINRTEKLEGINRLQVVENKILQNEINNLKSIIEKCEERLTEALKTTKHPVTNTPTSTVSHQKRTPFGATTKDPSTASKHSNHDQREKKPFIVSLKSQKSFGRPPGLPGEK